MQHCLFLCRGASFFSIILVYFSISSCRSIKNIEDSDLQSSVSTSQVKLPVEPYPFNSLPIEVLERDAASFFKAKALPPLVPAMHAGTEQPYGVRYISSNRDIAKYVQPGDVFVEFEAIGEDYTDLMMMLQKGMYHAGIVLANQVGDRSLFFPSRDGDAFLCHLDTTAGYDPSGCGFTGPTHFFRIADSDPTQVRLYTEKFFNNWRYDYLFNLSIATAQDIPSQRKSVEKGEKDALYCSELPFLVHSLADGRLPFEPASVGQILSDWKVFQKKHAPLYKQELDNQAMTQSIVSYFASFLPSGVQSFLDNPLTRSYVKTALTKPDGASKADQGIAAKKIVTPWAFMDESKKDQSMVRYIGTFYPGSYKLVAIPIDALNQLREIESAVIFAQKTLSAASSSLAADVLATKVEGRPAGGRNKLGRVVQWVLKKPEPLPPLVDYKYMDQRWKTETSILTQLVHQASQSKNLSYESYLAICDQLKTSSTLLQQTRDTLVKAMRSHKKEPILIDSIERGGAGEDIRLQVHWEDFGCGLASRTLLEKLPVNPGRVREIER